MSAVAAARRAQAAAWRALADATEAEADALESAQSPDAWLDLEAAGSIAACRPRVIRDAGRRDELQIDHAGRSPRVRRSELDRWIASRRRSAPLAAKVIAESPREAGRRAAAAAAARMARSA